MKGVLDSMSELKTVKQKTLLDVVKDCFDNKEKVLANEADVVATLDSMWIDIHSDSLGEIAKAFQVGAKPQLQLLELKIISAVNKDSEETKRNLKTVKTRILKKTKTNRRRENKGF